MPTSPEQLERQIAVTRGDLARTLTELQDRASPAAILRRNKQRLLLAGGAVVGLWMLAKVLSYRRRRR